MVHKAHFSKSCEGIIGGANGSLEELSCGSTDRGKTLPLQVSYCCVYTIHLIFATGGSEMGCNWATTTRIPKGEGE